MATPMEQWTKARADLQQAARAYARELLSLESGAVVEVSERFDAVNNAQVALDDAALDFAAATARRLLAEHRIK